MDHQQLLRRLEAKNIIHEEQWGFSNLVLGIQNPARIVCAEIQREDGFHGISFWLYGEGNEWFIGLWSGICFRIAAPEQIVELADELLSGNVVSAGKAPFDLPEMLQRKYDLILIENPPQG